MRVLLLDNYDSFSYNLEYMLKQHAEVEVIRNDKIEKEICLSYDAIILSPGPGVPQAAGNMPDIISYCAGQVPILGICLGHQAIGEFLGAKLKNLSQVFHGKKAQIHVTEANTRLFDGLTNSLMVGRYHSWVIDSSSINNDIRILAISEEGHIMAIENKEMGLYGFQFHPESILTESGDTLISNFIKMIKLK